MRYVLIGVVSAVGIAAILHPPSSGPSLVIGSASPPPAPARRRITAPKLLVVYVAGAVKRPGLYRLQAGSRAVDAVLLAGGLRGDADPTGVDLAEQLVDGEEIAAPLAGARRTPVRGIRRPRTRSSKPKSKAMLGADMQIDLNAADAASLAQLPGIGNEMAARLVRFRDANGAFASLDELADVAGMTQHRIDVVTPYLYVGR